MRGKFSKLTARTHGAALVVSVIALIGAVGGSAFASAGSSDNKKDKKIAKAVANKVFSKRIGGASVANATNAAHVGAGGVRAGALGPITTVSATSAPFATGTHGSTFVQCPAGSVVLSGGGAGSAPLIFAELNRKSDPQGWRYDAFNDSGANATITVFAYCLAG